MIRTAAVDGVWTITIDRPARRNALRPADLTALESAVAEATDPVVYLEGAGDAFCAGADLDAVADLDEDAAAAFAAHGQRVANALASYDGAVVAGIDGAARGGGLELALACDARVATPDATMAEPGVALGLFGAWGGTARLPEIVGLGNAMDLGLSGRVIGPERAREMGLVSRIAEEPRAVAEEIAANDAAAVQTVKARTRDTGDRDQQEDAEASAFASLVADGATEGLNRNG
jgi:enoyl-CoA hydratase